MRATTTSVLISGLGIAGSTLAWWLARYGFSVTVVERAPAPRPGGYMIDFWGLGYDVAERMGAVEDLRTEGYLLDEVRFARADGGKFASIGAKAVRAAIGERFFSIMRGDLAGVLERRAGECAEIRFGETIRALRPRDDGVEVSFDRGAEARFDLLIGADGLHSSTRGMVCPRWCEHSLGFWTASFSTASYPRRDLGAYVSFTEVGRQVARYALREDRTAFFFIFRSPKGGRDPPQTTQEQMACLRERFGRAWECPEILARLDTAGDFYFDTVSQVRSPRWSSGRVALVGDAAYCPSLLAGEGASFAMAGAYVLAGELSACRGDYEAAFQRYDGRLRPLIERKQRGALRLGGWFAPRTTLGLFIRNGLNRLAALPSLAPLLMGEMLDSQVELPTNGDPEEQAKMAAAARRPVSMTSAFQDGC